MKHLPLIDLCRKNQTLCAFQLFNVHCKNGEVIHKTLSQIWNWWGGGGGRSHTLLLMLNHMHVHVMLLVL